jgi:hypothetical protein
MSRIFVPSNGPGDWRCLLADPRTQWERQYSARTIAHCWEDREGFPDEVRKVLAQEPALAGAEPLLIFPEWKVSLPGGTRPSQNDVWALARSSDGLVSMTVEGKVKESFDKTLAEWKVDASPGKGARRAFLAEVLGLATPLNDAVRYQLLHRAASAVIEAERFGAAHAVMLVHSFSQEDLWFDDFALFVSQFGLNAEVGRIASATARNGMPLHLGWVRGDPRYLNA